MDKRVNIIIKKLGLRKHIEGGYFSETYRSKEIIKKNYLRDKFSDERNLSTAIYFLLTNKDFSAFHRLKSDEIWHFYEGSSLNIYTISKTGNLKILKLGNNLVKNETFQITINSGQWFAAEIADDNSYCLVGCTVSPGFDFRDFELGKREELIKLYPQHKKIINKLTRK
jgi:predicted cupin superfamily sugar epimerase